jgi:hypothetical protein
MCESCAQSVHRLNEGEERGRHDPDECSIDIASEPLGKPATSQYS